MSADALSGGGAGDGGPGSEIPASAAYRISLPEFEGPLDLLLHLCKSHEIDIVNIPVAFVTEKYLEYLEMMQSLSVEVAAEYLVMAATLAYLKARELVPQEEAAEAVVEEGTEEALDPREELIRRLLEYQKYKDAAEKLGGRPIEGRNVFGRGMPMEAVGDAGLAEHSVWKLIEAWSKVLETTKPKYEHQVVIDRISISDRINQLIDRLETDGALNFEALVDMNLPEVELRHQVVVTLLAVLELAKLRVIRVMQEQSTGVFFVTPREGASLDAARRAKVTSDSSAMAAEPQEQEEGAEENAPEPPAMPTSAAEAFGYDDEDEEIAGLSEVLAEAGVNSAAELTLDDLAVPEDDAEVDADRSEVAEEATTEPDKRSEGPDGAT